jgi:hypothetical protein
MYIISIHESDVSLKKNGIMLKKMNILQKQPLTPKHWEKRRTWKPPPHQMR